jgi:protein TonB
VRRLLLAAALALAFHSLLFTIRFEGPRAKLILPPRPLTLSLAHGPNEPPPSLAVSKITEPPDPPPPHRPQLTEEKRQPQKTGKREKPSKSIDPSVPLQQGQASLSTVGGGFIAEETLASGTSQESPFPTRASAVTPLREATPLYRRNLFPEYPMIARKRGYQGTVVLEVLVSREGRVKDLSLSASSGYSVLDHAALTSVKTWLFDPGTRGGEKVDMWVKVPVRFQLE